MNAIKAILMAGVMVSGCATQGTLAPAPGHFQPVEEAVSINTPGTVINGTLVMPSGVDRPMVALIIAGSGPTDRNGNSPLLKGSNNAYKMLAEGLAARGIATVRYDKRGIGASAMGGRGEADLRFTTYSDDAALWVRQLQSDKRFGKVIVIGHSEGALLGTIAARETSADGLILLAGAGRPVGVVLREQLMNNMPALAASAEPILRELEAGRPVADVPANLQMLFRASVQPYMISWLPLDPRAELAKVRAPRLVVQGTTDVQAAPSDAQRLASADKRVRLEMIEGMNHVLKVASGDAQAQMPSYGDPSLPLAPHLLDVIMNFINAQIR